MNRQVPEKIAIVGNGNVARHMMHYFASVGQPYTHWFRKQTSTTVEHRSRLARYQWRLKQLFKPTHSNTLETTVATAAAVLLLIPDDQIKSFIKNNPILKDKKLIHFSGSLILDGVVGCHPLMTFGPQLYGVERYPEIPFVVDQGVEFKALFPLLKNPVHSINAEHKAVYHALCVMAGNFSQMLWRAVSKEMQALGLPQDLMAIYLQQNTQNFIEDPENSATGPFVRGDAETIAKHQKALINHPLGEVYQAFFELHHQPEQQANRKSL